MAPIRVFVQRPRQDGPRSRLAGRRRVGHRAPAEVGQPLSKLAALPIDPGGEVPPQVPAGAPGLAEHREELAVRRLLEQTVHAGINVRADVGDVDA